MSWVSDKLGLKQIGQQARADIIMLKELAALELLAFQTGRLHYLLGEVIET